MKPIKSGGLKITKSKRQGRGVFATKSFKSGAVVECSPVLIFVKKEIENLHRTKLDCYTYQWGDKGDQAAIVFGFGSFYNHSYNPNVKYVADHEKEIMKFIALRSIKNGQEITINYNGEPDDLTSVHFDVIED